MPTARELLEEVDALMRRNRAAPETRSPLAPAAAPPEAGHTEARPPELAHEAAFEPPLEVPVEPSAEKAGFPAEPAIEDFDQIPVLTEVADWERAAVRLIRDDPEAGEEPLLADELLPDDVPLLTDAVELDATTQDESVLQPDAGVVSQPGAEAAGDAGLAVEGAPASTAPGVSSAPFAASIPVGPSAPSAAEPLAPDDPRWEIIAEEVRIEVLQRIDLFTDTGLQTRLREHLQPIVDRAGAELIDVLNRHVGDLVRDYVAEAIERAIEKRRDPH